MGKKLTDNGGWFELQVDSDPKNLSIIADFLDDAMTAAGARNEKDRFEVQLAVDEACTNIIEHAYKGRERGKITIQCRLSESKKEFIIKLIDTGKPFDPNTVPAPNTDASLEERTRGGYGIYFMKQVMQTVKYAFSDKGNELTMVKLLS